SGLRHLAQNGGDDPAKRRAGRGRRVSEKSAKPGAAYRVDQSNGNPGSRAVARERHALCGTRASRSEVERRPVDRFHAGASDADQPADCRDAERYEVVPAVGSGARSARASRRLLREGGRRNRDASEIVEIVANELRPRERFYGGKV